MRNIQHNNALLYEKHKGLVDDLASEGRALRRELVESCKAFAEAMPETVTDELRKEAFDLFMRDVHIAHDEFQKRLGSLCDRRHASELERLNKEKDELNNRIANLRIKLEKQEKDSKSLSKRLNGDITDLRVKLEKQEKDNITLSKIVDELQNKISKTEKSFDGTLKEITEKINNLIICAQVIEDKRWSPSTEMKSAIEDFREVTRMLRKYRRDHIEPKIISFRRHSPMTLRGDRKPLS